MAVKKKMPMKGKGMEMSAADRKRDKGKKEMPVEFMEYAKGGKGKGKKK